MAIKTLSYTVASDGIKPSYEQNAGMQYDHNKTQLQFTIDKEFYNTIIENLGAGETVYRFDCYDGEGNLHLGEIKHLNGMALEPYMLEYWVTKFGGKLKICLVITNTENNNTSSEFYCETVVYLEDLPESDVNEVPYKSLSSLTKQSEEYVNQVKSMKNEVIKLNGEISSIKSMLEDGEWVFDSEAGENIDVEFVVDNQLDENSNNLLSNALITQKFNEVDNKIDNMLENMGEHLYDTMIGKILLAMYPIGSYYWSSMPDTPETLFGGVWEQVKDVFVLAAGEEYVCGATGGEAKHLLTEKEMPSHKHMFKPSANGNGIDFVIPTQSLGTGTSSIGREGKAHYPGHWASMVWGTDYRGKSQSHNNMPPYITAYCWKRIA